MVSTDISQPIWRYMRLETLLRLLREGRIFLPTLATLKQGDPGEGEIVRRANLQRSDINQLEQNSEWLVLQATTLEKKQLEGELRGSALREIWLRELAKRRLVWCWHAAKAESMAQWQIYAHKGVAIRSTPAAVLETLQAANAFPKPFGVRYLADGKQQSLRQGLNRPFLFKRFSFRFEREVRFVMSCRSLEQHKGVCLPGVSTNFIHEIVVSPFCLADEADAVVETLRVFFQKSAPLPPIRHSEQRTAPTKSTFLDELLDSPDESVIDAGEADIPSLFHQL